MAFVYLLLSLIASVLQEMIAAILQLRPANLLRGIRSLFSGDSIWGKDLVDSLYTHGLIRGLYPDPQEDLKERQPAVAAGGAPAAPEGAGIAAQTSAPVGSSMLNGVRALVLGLAPVKWKEGVRGISDQKLLPSYIPSRTFAMAIVDMLNEHKTTGADTMKSITQSLADHNWQYRDNKAVQAMYALALNANGDLQAFQRNLENWYNDSMDRASGWYKRHVQRILLGLGLLLAVLFNVDSVRVARTLWVDRDARQAMVNAADQYVKEHPTPKASTTAGTTAAAETKTGDQAETKTPASGDELEKSLKDTTGAFRRVTDTAMLPVGWKSENVAKTLWEWAVLMVGWLVTGLAISLGAPFWFDVLNKFMVVRNTVKPQEKSLNEGSKA